MDALPILMVAPNGARRTHKDHPALPVTIEETVADAKACFAAGAKGIHLHVRDAQGEHTLDVGLYREALKELQLVIPDMAVQITTESVGRYKPLQQRQVVEQLKPASVSIAIRELIIDSDKVAVMDFYNQCAGNDIQVQHIVYSPGDVSVLYQLVVEAGLPQQNLQMLLVLGRYTEGQVSTPNDLPPFLKRMNDVGLNPNQIDWALCAFGQNETPCLEAAYNAGGKMRVGFENSFQNSDGSIATNNAERVAEIVTQCHL